MLLDHRADGLQIHILFSAANQITPSAIDAEDASVRASFAANILYIVISHSKTASPSSMKS
jgi:hypothetical protein